MFQFWLNHHQGACSLCFAKLLYWYQLIYFVIKIVRRTAGYIWTDYKTNVQTAKELKITPILDKLLEYKTKWI